jgi:L-ascorbate metabolism protein UlaG (beta-lactamase superfamily)
MKVTYYGHSCFAVEAGGKTLLFDPFIRPNPLAKAINPETIAADFILISHAHEDHLADAIFLAGRTGATVISNFEICEWLGKQGVTRVHALNHGGGFNFDFGRVKFVNAVHSSALPDCSYGGNAGGFVIETRDGNFYYSGDTALTLDMKLIGESTPLAFAALCIGDNFTMGVDDAIKAADFIRCGRIMGAHYDTFPQIQIDHAAAVKKFHAAGKELHLLKIGASHVFSVVK